MALDNAKNFAKVTVSTGYDASATSIVLTTGHGAKLPTAPFNAVWWNSTDYPDPSDDPNVEIVRVTGISTDTLTVTRGQESISASTKNTGGKTYKMIAGLTAKVINTDIPALGGGSSVKYTVSELYQSNLKKNTTVAGSGAATFPTTTWDFLTLNTVGGATSSVFVGWNPIVAGFLQGQEAFLAMVIRLNTVGSDSESFFGLATGGIRNMTGGNLIDYTISHIGFKITWASSGTISMYATVANATTETASAALTTLSVNDRIEMFVQCHGTTSLTSVDFYWRKNDGSLSSATNITTNLPAANTDVVCAMVGNKNVDNGNQYSIGGATFSR
jgi:hypothetical protein